jgi:hypothetical protein
MEIDSESLCSWTSGDLGVECPLLSLSVSSSAAALLWRSVGCG